MKQIVPIAVALLLTAPGPLKAECAGSPPTTGLGSCIDFMLATSQLLTGQANGLGYTFSFGNASYTDFVAKEIVIPAYNCESFDTTGLYFRTAVLAHELGHAELGLVQDTSSKEAFVESWCDHEGYAVINNIHGRAETLICSMNAVDIAIAASNGNELLSIFNSGGNAVKNVGSSFCDHNVTSTTGQNYRDFYGDYYDAHYGQ